MLWMELILLRVLAPQVAALILLVRVFVERDKDGKWLYSIK
jgi:hypothetical protein